MSFDERRLDSDYQEIKVSIPFDQGNVFRRLNSYATEWKKDVSIPFDQGNVFRQKEKSQAKKLGIVSIPFDQGNVFRLQRYAGGRNHAAFQTHFPIFLEG